MNAPALSAGRDPRGMRLAMICGSIKPLFCGVEDYNTILGRALRQQGVLAETIDIGRWKLTDVPRLLRAVAAARPDAIVLQYPTIAFGYSLLPQAFAALQRIAPLVVVLHEYSLAHPLRRIAVAGLLLRASAIIATAEKEALAVVRASPWLKRRVHVIPIGSNIPARDWQPGAVPTIVSFGQIRPEKGLEDFLACQESLQKRFPLARFLVIGSPVAKFAAYYDQMRAEFERRGITLLTNLAEDDVAEQLSQASVAVLPIAEGVSFRRGTFLAAAGCGTPIAAYTGYDTPAELRAILPEITDRAQLVNAIAAILVDPDEREAAHRRSLRVSALAGWDEIVRRFLAVLPRKAAKAS